MHNVPNTIITQNNNIGDVNMTFGWIMQGHKAVVHNKKFYSENISDK